MVVDERRRAELARALGQAIGDGPTGTLFEMLPPAIDETATRSDVRGVRTELDHFRAEVDARFAEVDARFDRVGERFDRVDERFDRVDERFDQMESSFEIKLEALKQELRAETESALNRAVTGQTKSLLLSLFAAVIAIAALAFATL
jgi:predicted nuclease with TOPRIM domain